MYSYFAEKVSVIELLHHHHRVGRTSETDSVFYTCVFRMPDFENGIKIVFHLKNTPQLICIALRMILT